MNDIISYTLFDDQEDTLPGWKMMAYCQILTPTTSVPRNLSTSVYRPLIEKSSSLKSIMMKSSFVN